MRHPFWRSYYCGLVGAKVESNTARIQGIGQRQAEGLGFTVYVSWVQMAANVVIWLFHKTRHYDKTVLMGKIDASDLFDFDSINRQIENIGLQIPDKDRCKKLKQRGFKDIPTLGNLFRFTEGSTYFPLSVTRSWDKWKGVALESDGHYMNPFESVTDTPENAAADVVIWMIDKGHIKK